MGGKKDPELLDIPGAEGLSVDFFKDLMNYQAPTKDIPLQGVAGMSAAEQTTQNLLGKYLGTQATYKPTTYKPGTYAPGTYKSTATEGQGYKLGMEEIRKTLGGEFYDPRKSDFWKGFRDVSKMEQEQGVADIRRRGQLGGGLYATPNQRTEAEYIGKEGSKRQMMLGGLYENERNRKTNAVAQALGYAGFEEQSKQFGASFGEQSRQFGAGLGEQSRQFGAGLGEQSRQFGKAFEEQGMLSRLGAGATIGALPRNIKNQELQALYNQQSGQVDADFLSSILQTQTQTGAAEQLMPQWNIDQGSSESPLGGILGLLGAVIGK